VQRVLLPHYQAASAVQYLLPQQHPDRHPVEAVEVLQVEVEAAVEEEDGNS
jgi:hypothetical protein